MLQILEFIWNRLMVFILALFWFQCIGPSWYISADFQMYVLSPIILFPLYKWGYKFFPIPIVGSLAASIYVMVMCIVNDFTFHYRTLFWWFDLYYATHCRFGTYVLGILFGYFLYDTKDKRWKLDKLTVMGLWTISTIICFLCVFIGVPSYINRTEDIVLFGIHQGFHRILWSLAIAWVVSIQVLEEQYILLHLVLLFRFLLVLKDMAVLLIGS